MAYVGLRERRWQAGRGGLPDYDTRECGACCAECGNGCLGGGHPGYPDAHMCVELHQWGHRTRRSME